MTQEEKANAYEEALEKARKYMDAGSSDLTDVLPKIFPELAESEDERIRKELVQYLKDYPNIPTGQYSKSDFYAYLEKQKEIPMPSSTELIEKWDKEKTMLEEKDFRGDEWRLAYTAYMDGFADGACVKLGKQKEQEPELDGEVNSQIWQIANNSAKTFEQSFAILAATKKAYDKGKKDAKKEQKPAEWSEEENDKIIKEVISYLNDEVSFISPVEGMKYRFYLANRLKSLFTQPKPEWNEEDEDMLNSCISSIEEAKENRYAYNETDGDTSYDQEISWLKSLRPQPKAEKSDYITPHKEFFRWIYDRLINVHKEDPNVDYMISFKQRIEELPLNEPQWKPSRKQIDALVMVLTDESMDDNFHSILVELTEQLKKLLK